MKILVIADCKPKNKIKDIVDNNQPDLICTLGDLDFFILQDLSLINNIPKIGVYGNHCSGRYLDELGIKNMHLSTFEYGGMIFGGFEGSVKYKESNYAKMYTQEQAKELLKDFPKVDVMITHCPPYGVNDDTTEISHTGFLALAEYIENKSPKYLFHGHTYPREGELVKKYLDTNIIYVYGDKIVII